MTTHATLDSESVAQAFKSAVGHLETALEGLRAAGGLTAIFGFKDKEFSSLLIHDLDSCELGAPAEDSFELAWESVREAVRESTGAGYTVTRVVDDSDDFGSCVLEVRAPDGSLVFVGGPKGSETISAVGYDN